MLLAVELLIVVVGQAVPLAMIWRLGILRSAVWTMSMVSLLQVGCYILPFLGLVL